MIISFSLCECGITYWTDKEKCPVCLSAEGLESPTQKCNQCSKFLPFSMVNPIVCFLGHTILLCTECVSRDVNRVLFCPGCPKCGISDEDRYSDGLKKYKYGECQRCSVLPMVDKEAL